MDELSPYSSLPEAFQAALSARPSDTAYLFFDQEGTVRSRSYEEVASRVHHIALFLKTAGVTAGTRVAILSNTRPEWSEADLAIVWLGAITVSIYPSLPPHDIGVILADSGATIVFAENGEQVEKLLALRDTPLLIPGQEEEVRLAIDTILSFEPVTEHAGVTSWSSLVEAPLSDPLPIAEIRPGDLASLVYTSGTTGIPKGVMQTHRNHLSNVVQAAESGVFGLDGILFLYLPLAHSFARLVQWLGLLTEARVLYTRVPNSKRSVVDLASVATDMRTGGSQYVPSVPRLFEKIKGQIERTAAQHSVPGLMIRGALWAARAHADPVKRQSLLAQIAFAGTEPIRRLLKKQIFGNNFQHAISGGAKLPVDVFDFFTHLEIPILEGYGLTETCVATHINRVGAIKRGTVGTPFRRLETRIADDGEVLMRGPNVAVGYYHKPAETAESFDAEGWFHSGDLGAVDEEGYLSITGRKKELLVTAGGKKVPTQKIENLLQSHHLISHAVLVGEGKPFCAAVVTIDLGMLSTLAKKRGVSEPADPASCEWVMNDLQSHLAFINKELASFEQVKKVAIVSPEFSVENGLLTPTLKVRRSIVVERHRDTIERLFSSSSHKENNGHHTIRSNETSEN